MDQSSRPKTVDQSSRPKTGDQSSRPKTVDFEAVLETIMANLASSTQRVSGDLRSHSQSWLVTFTTLAKASRATKLCPRLRKYGNMFETSKYSHYL